MSASAEPSPPLAPLLAEVERRYGLACGAVRPLTGGEEGLLWRVAASSGPVVVRLDPPDRSLAEVSWIHRVAAHVAARTGLAPIALRGRDGSRAFVHHGRVVSVMPFVSGVPLDPARPGCLEAAAAALARLHAALADWRGPPRPKPSPWAPANWPADRDPPALVDRELDRRLAAWRARQPRPGRDLIHGDFFPGNLVWSEGAVAAVIDWYEARVDAPIVELASALWEFARDSRRGELDRAAARRFLAAYRRAGGTAASGAEAELVPLIRSYLRLQARYLRAAADALPGDVEYVESLTRAFAGLRRVSLPAVPCGPRPATRPRGRAG